MTARAIGATKGGAVRHGRRAAVMGRWLCAVLAVLLICDVTSTSAQGRSNTPVLSTPVLESLPPAVRKSLSDALAAVETQPGSAPAAGRLAMLLHAYEQQELAAAYYQRAQQLAPGQMAWPYLCAIVRSELGYTAEAVELFRRALELDAGYLPARLRLADVLLAAGDARASRAEYETLVAAYPELALARYGLGRSLAAQNDPGAAVLEYDAAVQLAPQFGAAHYALALGYRDLGKADAAARHLEAYRGLGPRRPMVADPVLDDVRSLGGTARSLIAEAARLGDAGQVEAAIRLHLEALAADATATQAHVNLIALYGRTGRADQAEQHYRSAVKSASHLADAHYNFGVLLASTGRRSEAIDVFRRALEADPFHPRAHNNLGALFARDGSPEQAVAHYRQALASDPRHHTARFGLARVLLALGRPAESIVQLEKLLALPDRPETPRVKLTLASAWLASGDPARARRYAEEARRDAARLGQHELIGAIDKEIETIRAAGG